MRKSCTTCEQIVSTAFPASFEKNDMVGNLWDIMLSHKLRIGLLLSLSFETGSLLPAA